jgi:hypothetical protein
LLQYCHFGVNEALLKAIWKGKHKRFFNIFTFPTFHMSIPIWNASGRILEPFWRILGPSCPTLGPCQGHLGAPTDLLSAMWAFLEASWAVLDPSWGPLGLLLDAIDLSEARFDAPALDFGTILRPPSWILA